MSVQRSPVQQVLDANTAYTQCVIDIPLGAKVATVVSRFSAYTESKLVQRLDDAKVDMIIAGYDNAYSGIGPVLRRLCKILVCQPYIYRYVNEYVYPLFIEHVWLQIIRRLKSLYGVYHTQTPVFLDQDEMIRVRTLLGRYSVSSDAIRLLLAPISSATFDEHFRLTGDNNSVSYRISPLDDNLFDSIILGYATDLASLQRGDHTKGNVIFDLVTFVVNHDLILYGGADGTRLRKRVLETLLASIVVRTMLIESVDLDKQWSTAVTRLTRRDIKSSTATSLPSPSRRIACMDSTIIATMTDHEAFFCIPFEEKKKEYNVAVLVQTRTITFVDFIRRCIEARVPLYTDNNITATGLSTAMITAYFDTLNKRPSVSWLLREGYHIQHEPITLGSLVVGGLKSAVAAKYADNGGLYLLLMRTCDGVYITLNNTNDYDGTRLTSDPSVAFFVVRVDPVSRMRLSYRREKRIDYTGPFIVGNSNVVIIIDIHVRSSVAYWWAGLGGFAKSSVFTDNFKQQLIRDIKTLTQLRSAELVDYVVHEIGDNDCLVLVTMGVGVPLSGELSYDAAFFMQYKEAVARQLNDTRQTGSDYDESDPMIARIVQGPSKEVPKKPAKKSTGNTRNIEDGEETPDVERRKNISAIFRLKMNAARRSEPRILAQRTIEERRPILRAVIEEYFNDDANLTPDEIELGDREALIEAYTKKMKPLMSAAELKVYINAFDRRVSAFKASDRTNSDEDVLIEKARQSIENVPFSELSRVRADDAMPPEIDLDSVSIEDDEDNDDGSDPVDDDKMIDDLIVGRRRW